jgi:hypothetical protein
VSTFTVIPGTLNLTVKRGDTISVTIDFTNVLTGYSISAEAYSTVDGSTIVVMTTDGSQASEGKIVVSLSSSETAGLPSGTYNWKLKWQTGSQIRTAVQGILEVLP